MNREHVIGCPALRAQGACACADAAWTKLKAFVRAADDFAAATKNEEIRENIRVLLRIYGPVPFQAFNAFVEAFDAS